MVSRIVVFLALVSLCVASFDQHILESKGFIHNWPDPQPIAPSADRPHGNSACSATLEGHTYDVSGLKSYVMELDTDYGYAYVFCNALSSQVYPKCQTVQNPNACQVYSGGTNAHALSSWDQTITFAKVQGAEAITIAVTGGDQGRWTTAKLNCNKDVKDAPKLTAIDVTYPEYTYSFDTIYGCSDFNPPHDGGDGLSGGSIFIIILCCVVPVYIVGGCIYKRQRLGATGAEMCPNVDFWKALPGYFWAGCKWTFGKMTSCCRKGEGYDTVH